MDIEQERQKFNATLAQIRDAGSRSQLEAEFEVLAGRHAAATDKAPIEAEIEQLQQRASQAVQAQGGPGAPGPGQNGGGGGGPGGGGNNPEGFLTWAGYGLAVLLILLAFGFAVFYFNLDQYPTIEGTRPLLVLTLIVSMLAFGGLLIVRALFAPTNGEELQTRFRMAREIFLVFSGIFGTIIGFYFGADDDEGAGGRMSLNVAIAAERQLTVTATGGAAPYRGILTIEGASGDIYARAQEPVLRFSIPEEACPRSADIIVVDGRGRLAETEVPQSNAELRAAGWTACPAGDSQADNSTENETSDANQTDANANGTNKQ